MPPEKMGSKTGSFFPRLRDITANIFVTERAIDSRRNGVELESTKDPLHILEI